MIADQLQRLVEIVEARFVITFVNVGDTNAEIRFRQSAPVAILTKTFQSSLRIITLNRVLADRAIDARQGSINMTRIYRAALPVIAQSRLQHRDRFRMIAVVVVSESDLNAKVAGCLLVELGARFRFFVHRNGGE